MQLKTWCDVNPGGINTDAGNALKKFTGNYRSGKKPVFSEETCINCFLCWVFCPDNAIIVEQEKVTGIDYDYCKGCGICITECPVEEDNKPLSMTEEKVEL